MRQAHAARPVKHSSVVATTPMTAAARKRLNLPVKTEGAIGHGPRRLRIRRRDVHLYWFNRRIDPPEELVGLDKNPSADPIDSHASPRLTPPFVEHPERNAAQLRGFLQREQTLRIHVSRQAHVDYFFHFCLDFLDILVILYPEWHGGPRR